MVSIDKEIRDELYREEDYVHWDTDNSSDEEETLLTPTIKKRKVASLTTLVLRTIFTRRCLGKVPKKLRKVKNNFDLFNVDDDYNINLSNIITNLDEDSNVNDFVSLSDNNVDDKGKDNVKDADVSGVNFRDDTHVENNKISANVENGFELSYKNSVAGEDHKNNYNINDNSVDNAKDSYDSIEYNGVRNKNGNLECDTGSTNSQISEDNSNHTSSSKDILEGYTEKNEKNYDKYSEDDKRILEELDAQIDDSPKGNKVTNSIQNFSMDFNFDP